MKKKKEAFYRKITNWANKKGFENIKANVEGYETPKSFTRQANTEDAAAVTPDATAVNHGVKYYFEIAMKPNDRSIRQRLISKWKLLSFLAERKGGKLYLFAPHGNKSFTQKIIEQYGIKAQFVSLSKVKAPAV